MPAFAAPLCSCTRPDDPLIDDPPRPVDCPASVVEDDRLFGLRCIAPRLLGLCPWEGQRVRQGIDAERCECSLSSMTFFNFTRIFDGYVAIPTTVEGGGAGRGEAGGGAGMY